MGIMSDCIPVVWTSPLTVCDCCGGDFVGVMYDASVRTSPVSPKQWGNVCETCFVLGDGKLGTGYGQRYQLKAIDDKRYWIKTAG